MHNPPRSRASLYFLHVKVENTVFLSASLNHHTVHNSTFSNPYAHVPSPSLTCWWPQCMFLCVVGISLSVFCSRCISLSCPNDWDYGHPGPATFQPPKRMSPPQLSSTPSCHSYTQPPNRPVSNTPTAHFKTSIRCANHSLPCFVTPSWLPTLLKRWQRFVWTPSVALPGLINPSIFIWYTYSSLFCTRLQVPRCPL